MKKIIVALLTVVMVICCLSFVACKAKVDGQAILDSYIFEKDNAVVSEDFILPATIGGQETEWKSNNNAVTLEKRDNDWLAKVNLPETDEVTVTLTLTVAKVSKDFTVRVLPIDVYDIMDNYAFAQSKATVDANFALDSECTYRGKKATIVWTIDNEYENYIKIVDDGKTCQVTPQSEQTPVKIMATFTYNGESATMTYDMIVYKTMEGMELVNYWYTNVGVSIDMSGYVVAIATEYSTSYKNVSLYMVNDDFTAGYYLFRVKTTDEDAAKLKPGVHITCTGTTNQNYNGLIETNAGGKLVVDSDIAPINVKDHVYAIDEEVLGDLPSTVYHESRLVSLSNWKVKSVCADADKATGSNFTLMTLTKGGVDVQIRVSKYMEGAYATKADDATWMGLCNLTTSAPVGTMVNVTGILSKYGKSWQIMPLSADDVTASGLDADADDKRDYDGMKVANAIKAVNASIQDQGLLARLTANKEATLPTTVGDVSVAYEIIGSSNAVAIDGGKVTVTVGSPEKTTILVTYQVGEFKAIQFVFISSVLPSASTILDDFTGLLPTEIKEVVTLPTAEDTEIVWSVVKGEDSIAISNGQLVPTLKEDAVSVIIKAQLTYKGETREKTYLMTVAAGKGVVAVAAPFEEGRAYALAVKQGNLDKTLYAIDKIDKDFLKTTDNYEQAGEVFVEKVGEDYRLYFKATGDVKHYISMVIKKNSKDVDTPYLCIVEKDAQVWTWDATNNCFTFKVAVNNADGTPATDDKGNPKYNTFYMGTYNSFETLNISNISYIKTAFTAFLGNIEFVPLQENAIVVEKAENTVVNLDMTKGYNGQKFSFTVSANEQEIACVKVNGEEVKAVNGVYTAYVNGKTTISVIEKVTVAQATASATGRPVQLTGIVSSVDTAWNDSYKNMTVTLKDSEGNTISIYRLGTKVEEGDTITVTGKVGEYKGVKQITNGTATIDKKAETPDPTPDTTVKPVVGSAYRLVMNQTVAGKVVYIVGTMSSYYMSTVEDIAGGINAYIVAVDGGYNLYVSSDNGATKKYINVVASGTHFNAVFADAATSVWVWDDAIGTLKTDLNGQYFVLGTKNDGTSTYTTVGAVKVADNPHMVKFVVAPTGGDTPVDPVDPDEPQVVTIAEAKELADGVLVTITGYVSEITYNWSDTNNNMSINLKDSNGDVINCFKLATKVNIGDTITVTGKVGSYNGSKQIAEGATAVIVTAHVECTEWTEATCLEPAKCVLCGKVKEGSTALGHVDEDANGVCDRCDAAMGTGSEKKSVAGSTGALDGDTITWTATNFVVTGKKAGSTSDIRTDDTNHFRLYKNSTLEITAKGEKKITKIVITCQSGTNSGQTYAENLAGSLTTAGATASVDGTVVTIEVSSDASLNSVAFTAIAQTRFVSIEVYYVD